MKSICVAIGIWVVFFLGGCAATNKMFHPGAATNIDGSDPVYDRDTTSIAILTDGRTIQAWSDILEARASLSKSPTPADFRANQITEWLGRYTDFSDLDSFQRAELESAYRSKMAQVMLDRALTIDNTLFVVKGEIQLGEYDVGRRAYPVGGFSTRSTKVTVCLRSICTKVGRDIASYDPISKRLTLAGDYGRKKATIALSGSVLLEAGIHDPVQARDLKKDWYSRSQPFVIVSEFVEVANFGEPQIFFNGLCKVIESPSLKTNRAYHMNTSRSDERNRVEACALGNKLFSSKPRVASPNLSFTVEDL